MIESSSLTLGKPNDTSSSREIREERGLGAAGVDKQIFPG